MTTRRPTFGFCRWDVFPKRDESTLRFFGRMVEREGDDNFRRFAYMNGVTDTSVHEDEIVRFLERHPYPEAVKEHFRRSAFVRLPTGTRHQPRRFEVRGEIFNIEDIARRHRWCRACLHESSHGRLWFNIRPIRRCPYHGIALEDHLRSGGQIPFYRTGYQEVVEEGLFARPRMLRTGSFEHYLLGRLDCEDGFNVPHLDDASLADVIDVCENIGMLISRLYSRRFPVECGPDEADAGFQVIRFGPANLAKTLLAWVQENVRAEDRSRDTAHLFTWAYHRISARRGHLQELVLNAMHVVNAAVKGSPREITDEYVNSKVIALDAAADELKIFRRDFSVIVKELGLIEPGPGRRRRGMATCDLPKVSAFLDTLLDRRALAEMLGVAGYELFAKAGYLRVYHTVGEGRGGPRFRPEDAARILETLDALTATGRTDIARTFHSAATYKWGQRQLAVKVLQGKVKVAGVRDRGNGFSRLLIEVDNTKRPKPFRNGGSKIMAIEASRIVGIPSRYLSLLVDAGEVSYVLDENGKRVFSRTELQAFVRQNVKQGAAAKVLGKYGRQLAKELRGKGIVPAVSLKHGKWDINFYNKVELAKAYGVEADVFDLDCPRLRIFWSSFLAYAHIRAPGLRLPTEFPLAGCWGGTAVKHGMVKFTYEQSRHVLNAVVAPIKTSGISFAFDVDKDFSEKLFLDLFAAIDRYNAVVKARAAERAVRLRKRSSAQVTSPSGRTIPPAKAITGSSGPL